MKPSLTAAAVICLIISTSANADKKLTDKDILTIEPEESQSQQRNERCATCGGGGQVQLKLNPPNILASLQALPKSEVHSQSSFEGCSSDKGCAGIKVKDGQVVEKFGNLDAFRAAAASDTANEFSFHPAGVFDGGIPKDGPFWWMNENSPFKANAGGYEKVSKQSSYSSSGSAGNGAGLSASLDLSGNPFLNGNFAKLTTGFGNQGQLAQDSSYKPSSSSYQSSYESSYSTNNKNGEVDLSKNPYLNGGYRAGQSGYQGQASFGAGSPQSYSNNKYASSSYTGSSPSPFTASTAGSNINLIQSSQKASEFDYEQSQQQQNIDEIFQETGNVLAHEGHTGGDLQQTCAGQGYVCVHKAQCNNGVVNTNGGGILQAKTKKQYCNIKTEICCRIEISTLQGAGGLQGSLGVGSATFSGSGSQGSGLFVSNSQSGSSFGAEASGSRGSSFGADASGSASRGSSFGSESSSSSSKGTYGSETQGSRGSSFGSEASGSRGTSYESSGSRGTTFESDASGTRGTSYESETSGSRGTNYGSENGGAGQSGQAGQAGYNGQGYGSSSSSFESSSSSFGSSNNGQNYGGQNGFNAQGSSSFDSTQGTFGANGQGSNTNNQGFGVNGGNRDVYESSSSSFETSSRGNGNTGGKFNTNFNANGVGTAQTPNQYGGFNTGNEVVVKETKTTQTNIVETDSFSSGSDQAGVYRGTNAGNKPGIPYLPPVDNSNSGTNVVSSTASFNTNTYGTSARPTYNTPKPTYLPPVSTAAPGYLPPEGEQSINTETRVPGPNYNEGELILDENRPPRPKKPVPVNNEIPAGCAAALKCTPVEFCTAEGVISNTSVALTRDQEAFRVPLTDCKDIESGRTGKCCRDPNYSDPWPTNLIGKWTEGVFGGNDGKYTPDNRGSPNNIRPAITAAPPVTGSSRLDNFRTTPKPLAPSTPGYSATATASFGQKGQYEVKGEGQFAQGGQGQYTQGGRGQYGQAAQGQFGAGSQTQFTQNSYESQYSQKGQFGQRGQGQLGSQGQGQIVSQGQGQLVSQGQGQIVSQGQGQIVSQGQGQLVSQGKGQVVSQASASFGQSSRGQYDTQAQGAQSQFTQTQGQRGQGQYLSQGQGQVISQGSGSGIRQGQGFAVSQGSGFGVENEYSESIQRVTLQRYNAGGQCGVFNGQKPYGNRNELEVDFAEIPWQAMVLLQTNRSLLCGGVITRPDVVVTTASCVEGLLAKNVLIKGGEWKLGIDDEPLPYQIVQVKHILRHPFYKAGSLQYDAAILVLSENLRLAKNIYPICLPGAQETLDGFYNGAGECIVTGWGKQVLQAHLSGSILHSLNISLINPGECQAKLSQDYPHLLQQYDQDSCACGVPTNPINNVCRVDIGSALACTMGDGHFVLRGVYSWDSGCQAGNQLAAFYKFDLEWYEWAIGQIESTRFAQFNVVSQVSQNRYSGQINQGVKGGSSGVKGGVKGFSASASASSSSSKGFGGQYSQGQGQFGQFGQKQASQFGQGQFGQGQKGQFAQAQAGFGEGQNQFSQGQGYNQYSRFSESNKQGFGSSQPIQNSFSASYSEQKTFQSEPKIITYTTKPEIVTFTTKPEIFTYTTKPKIVTYTTKPQLVTYETSGSGLNPQYIAPGVTYNPGFAGAVGAHTHNAQCKCIEGKK